MSRQFGIDISAHRPKSVDVYAGQRFDYVITVCDSAAATCPTFPGAAERIHSSLANPAAVTHPAAARRAFEATATALAAQLRRWLAEVGVKRQGPAAEEAH